MRAPVRRTGVLFDGPLVLTAASVAIERRDKYRKRAFWPSQNKCFG